MGHILAGCPWVLNVENKLPREDRNTWRHNNVLLEIAIHIRRKLGNINSSPLDSLSKINFVRAGEHRTIPIVKKDYGLLKIARIGLVT